MIKKLFVTGLILILLFTFVSTTTFGMVILNQRVIIYVDDDGGADYTLIQDAVNAANIGDTVYVYDGVYYETVLIDKSIHLIGEDKHSTVIDADMKGCVIRITSDNVFVNGFTLCNSKMFEPGIEIFESNFNTISNNLIKNVAKEIYLLNSSYNILTENDLKNKGSYGIHLDTFSSNNIISKNNISHNGTHGIVLSIHCDDNNISENVIEWNHGSGILISSHSYSNYISNNIIRNNGEEGIFLWNGRNSIITNNIIENNGGMGILFYSGCNHNMITNNIIKHNNIKGHNTIGGIGLGTSHNNTISGNDINYNADEEIYIYESKNNDILNNNIIDDFYGRWGSIAFFEFEATNSLQNIIDDYKKAMSNHFHGNYWGKWRILPRPIKGEIRFNRQVVISWVFPAVIFDWKPANEPYNIPYIEEL